jgi:hypothetical protein
LDKLSDKLFGVRPVFRRLQTGLLVFVVIVFAFAYKDDITRMLLGNRHSGVIVKMMLPWGDDSRTCQLFNGNPVVQGGSRTMKAGDKLEMLCPTGNIEGDWRLRYVGTVKLDDTSEREFDNPDKYLVPVLCTKDGKVSDCVKASQAN